MAAGEGEEGPMTIVTALEVGAGFESTNEEEALSELSMGSEWSGDK